MSKEAMVVITQREYDSLLDSERKLNALECCGVDNWCGYGDAMQMLEEDDEDE